MMADVVLVCDWSLRRLNRLQSVWKVRSIPTVQSWNATYSSVAKNIENRRGARMRIGEELECIPALYHR